MGGYTLVVDYGTTFTVGVVAVDGAAEILEFDHSRYLPSLVLLSQDNELVVGRRAVNQAALEPERVAATPKRDVGKPALLLGGEVVPLPQAIGAVLGMVGREAARRFDGAAPSQLVLTHPAAWADERLAVLRHAAVHAGLPEPTLVPEPVAAAAHYADGALAPGSYVAVYDLGGGTFDVAVLRRGDHGFEVAGAPGGDPHLGGEDFDEQLRELIESHAADLDPEGFAAGQEASGSTARRERLRFRREIREAKEALSEDRSVQVEVPGLEEAVRVTRAEFNALIEGDLRRTVSLLSQAVADAGLVPNDLAAVYLTGGSSRIPLVSTLVAEGLGIMPTTQGDPKAVVALGARSAVDHGSPGTQPGRSAGAPVNDAPPAPGEPDGPDPAAVGAAEGPGLEDLMSGFFDGGLFDRPRQTPAGTTEAERHWCGLNFHSDYRDSWGAPVELELGETALRVRMRKPGARFMPKRGSSAPELDTLTIPYAEITDVTVAEGAARLLITYGGKQLHTTFGFFSDRPKALRAADAIERRSGHEARTSPEPPPAPTANPDEPRDDFSGAWPGEEQLLETRWCSASRCTGFPAAGVTSGSPVHIILTNQRLFVRPKSAFSPMARVALPLSWVDEVQRIDKTLKLTDVDGMLYIVTLMKRRTAEEWAAAIERARAARPNQ